MADEYGKKFELKLKEDFCKMGGSTIDRLYDPVGGFHGVSNICDFIGYKFPLIYYIECKTVKGNTFPIQRLHQYDKLLSKKGIKGAVVGAIIWFYEKDSVVFVPIETFEDLIRNGEKSFNLRKWQSNDEDYAYKAIEIPSVKKRVYMDSDYSFLHKYYEEEVEK